MEKKENKEGSLTDPVLNASGKAYRLKGLRLPLFGLIILAGYNVWIQELALGGFLSSMAFISIPELAMISGSFALVGWGLSLIGLILAQRGGGNFKPAIVCNILMMILTIVHSVTVGRSGLGALYATGQATAIGATIFTIMFFICATLGCRKIAMDCGAKSFSKKLIWKLDGRPIRRRDIHLSRI